MTLAPLIAKSRRAAVSALKSSSKGVRGMSSLKMPGTMTMCTGCFSSVFSSSSAESFANGVLAPFSKRLLGLMPTNAWS